MNRWIRWCAVAAVGLQALYATVFMPTNMGVRMVGMSCLEGLLVLTGEAVGGVIRREKEARAYERAVRAR